MLMKMIKVVEGTTDGKITFLHEFALVDPDEGDGVKAAIFQLLATNRMFGVVGSDYVINPTLPGKC